MNNRTESIPVINFQDIFDRGYENEHKHQKISDYIRKNYYDKFPYDNLLILINRHSLKENKLPEYYRNFLIEMIVTYDNFYLEYNG